jgi:excisionase family DNA binding protein
MTAAPDYLRAGDIARLSGASLRTVRRWIAHQILPSAKVGGMRLVPRKALTACSRLHRWTGRTPKKKANGNEWLQCFGKSPG